LTDEVAEIRGMDGVAGRLARTWEEWGKNGSSLRTIRETRRNASGHHGCAHGDIHALRQGADFSSSGCGRSSLEPPIGFEPMTSSLPWASWTKCGSIRFLMRFVAVRGVSPCPVRTHGVDARSGSMEHPPRFECKPKLSIGRCFPRWRLHPRCWLTSADSRRARHPRRSTRRSSLRVP